MTNLLISFSGGRTSAFMTHWLLNNAQDKYNMVVVFANTGREHEETLKFVKRCDDELGFKTVWIEAVTGPVFGTPIMYRIVDFETAARDGQPFEDSIKRYGIPNSAAPRCSQNLKAYPIRSFAKHHLKWRKRDYQTALGIRLDEMDRQSAKAKSDRLVYPLISMKPSTRRDVNGFWKSMPFDLEIPSYHGNCRTCWKKSIRKLMTIAREEPSAFDWDASMEAKYGEHIPVSRAGNTSLKPPIRFHRSNMTAADILKKSEARFSPARDEQEAATLFDSELDSHQGCEETCEPF